MIFAIETKRHNFGPHLKNCMFLCHLLSLAQKKIERTQILFRFSTAAHYLIDQLIKFRPHVDCNDEKCVDTAKSCVSSRSVSDV